MFCVVYCAPAMAQAVFDPDLGIDRALLVHGGQSFTWADPVCAGDSITTRSRLADFYEKDGKSFYVFESVSLNQEGEQTVSGRYTGIVRSGAGGKSGKASSSAARGSGSQETIRSRGHAQGDARFGTMRVGDPIPELRVTPDRYLPHRYAGASGDFTPIHIDAEFARSVGLPGIILHGLYTMALVARANMDAAGGDPRALYALSVEFRGVAVPEQEVVVRGTVEAITEGRAVVDTVTEQAGVQVIRNAKAVLQPV